MKQMSLLSLICGIQSIESLYVVSIGNNNHSLYTFNMKRVLYILMAAITILPSCKKEIIVTVDPFVPGKVIIENLFNNQVDITVYSIKPVLHEAPKEIVEHLILEKGEVYSYRQDMLEGDMPRDKINFLQCDSLDIQFDETKTLRLYGDRVNAPDENYRFYRYTRSYIDYSYTECNGPLHIVTFTIDDSLLSLIQ